MQITQIVLAVAALATTAFAGPVATASSTDGIANSCNGPNDSNTLAGIKNMQTTCQQIKSNAFTSSVSIGVAAAVAAMVL
ncbi:hypothetical protein HDU79_006663 [Rhizoclosmatium sp. JEL0117]|nr:hypothetical protein HDU79_006663 [Rhizoclosmatium sp. JEL0117]